MLAYLFIDDKLAIARYLLLEKHTNKNRYINDYEELQSILDEKYGAPEDEDALWLNDLYKDDYQKRGLAVSIGHLVYYTKWQAPGTRVSIFLQGENYDVFCAIEYISVKLEPRMDEAKRKSAMDKL